MSDDLHRTRLPLRPDGRARAEAVITSAGWPLVEHNAGAADDGELFAVVEAASRHPEPHVRNAAVWSTVHLTGARSIAMLDRIAAEDPDERVRGEAAAFATSFREQR